MTSGARVLYQPERGIAQIVLNRPEALNAMDMETLSEIAVALDRARSDPETVGVILTGAGGQAFSAGADVRLLSGASPLQVRELARAAVAVNHQVESLGIVVVAAIDGYALGGGLELAEACTFRVATPRAQLGHPEVKIGAVAGFGGTTRLPRLIGRGRAAELLLTGRIVAADEALSLGLVNRVVPAELLLGAAEDLIREAASCSPVAVRLTWEAMHRGMDLSLGESALLGADLFGIAAASEDFAIGTKSFIAKIRPAFTGR
ncbi:MAG: enoyl-CoA hydratase-related protein [Chloroflexota bacterium]|nr:enoyl-CoA hydratase-related protein [Chloroflexota bacterium]